MEMALENLSKQELIALLERQQTSISIRDEKINSLSSLNSSLVQEHDYLRSQVEMLKRMQFGQKRERFEGTRTKRYYLLKPIQYL